MQKLVFNILFNGKFTIKYNTMIADQVVSISELRKNATKYVKKAQETKQPQYIFINNKPQAMIVDLEYGHEGLWIYDKNWIEYVKPYPDEEEAIKEYEKEKLRWASNWTEAFSFLDSLMKEKNV